MNEHEKAICDIVIAKYGLNPQQLAVVASDLNRRALGSVFGVRNANLAAHAICERVSLEGPHMEINQ